MLLKGHTVTICCMLRCLHMSSQILSQYSGVHVYYLQGAQGDISVFTIISFTAYRVSYDYIQGVSVLPCTSAFPQMKLYTPGPIYNDIHYIYGLCYGLGTALFGGRLDSDTPAPTHKLHV